MSVSEIIYSLLISPLRIFFEIVFITANKIVVNPGLSIIALSLAINFLVLPLYKRADAVQEEERDTEDRLHDGIAHIKKTFKGDERVMMLQTYYRQNDYRPTDVFKGSISLFLEIPFFIAAYQFLSHLWILQGVSFGVIGDLGKPDGLLSIFGLNVNLLPIIMTGINLISCAIFTKGYPLKTKVQLYSMAIFFLIFLYDSPAGLVFYWTLNNLFSLIKTIFYKLKNPKKVLSILFAIIGTVIIIYGIGFYFDSNWHHRAFVELIGLACFCPFLLYVFKRKVNSEVAIKIRGTANPKLFWAGAVYLVMLIGVVIPVSVVHASPQELVDINYFVHPLWYICSTFSVAIGTFVIWMGVFYWLAGKTYRPIFDKLMVVLSVVATLDFMFYGRNLGTLSSELEFEEGLEFSKFEKISSLLVIVLVTVLVIFVVKKFQKVCLSVLSVAIMALAVMAVINMSSIHMSVAELDDEVKHAAEDTPEFNLCKSGKNVIVFMLDRGMNSYFPYILKEKPELREIFSGFTYYPNTISFGPSTNFGTPALFGGYEYTPAELNKRDTELLGDKHNEALKVMPVLFDENGYDVTVIDPPYAGYSTYADLSIYDDYPNIKAYHAKGKFMQTEIKEGIVDRRKSDFFCYSLMKSMPVIVQPSLYNSSNYNRYDDPSIPGKQSVEGLSVSKGISTEFLESYTVLQNLSNITHITEEGDTFMMIDNETPHRPHMLGEPDYSVEALVDNTEYDAENTDRFTVGGQSILMDTGRRMAHYHVNMASILEIAEWIKYLKENGVYDNTRIIITSDHGRSLHQLDNLILDDEGKMLMDAQFYYPLLLSKDFDADGEIKTNEEFMTNADTPVLAVDGIIDEPTNPFTGKTINDDEKYAHDQYIIASKKHNIHENNGTQFIPSMWLSVHDDMRKKENWSIVQKKAVLPY
ncbi:MULTISPECIES: YidC/Oxa1 family membrane protein insertase [unclassified Butyrivibrio]|uniref:YidC/Oxa1 family membrane protein insertase n=1 Tax=unclassified Butyrivibrio TaxID=2639466 RepID=UPI000403BADA|nr:MULTISPECIES: YidC/Oxa1 family membrane protein insertase [unclassified Butyrivibrio]